MNRSNAVRLAALGLGGAALLVGTFDVPGPLRAAVVASFFLFGPGAALVGTPPTWPALACITAIVSLSLAVTLILSTALLYLSWWSATHVLALLLATCAVGNLLALRSGVPT